MDTALDRLRALLDQGHEGEIAVLVRDFVRRMRAISDRALFPNLLKELTEDSDDATLLAMLWALTIHARHGDEGARQVAMELALQAEMFAHLEYERVRGLYEVARAAGISEVALTFLPNRPQMGLTVDEAEEENVALSLPLGIRKQASRTRDRLLIDRLLRDTNPQVIAVLLNNPKLRERDVVFVAAKRPTRPEVLRVVAAHPRWSTRYTVRKALACNPYTPTAISTRLLETLLRQDLVFVHSVGVLPHEVRREAQRILESRPVQAVEPAPLPAGPAPRFPDEDEEADIEAAAAEAMSMLGGPLQLVGAEKEDPGPRRVADSRDGRSWWAGDEEELDLERFLADLEG